MPQQILASTTKKRRRAFRLFTILIVFFFSRVSAMAAGAVDPAFNPAFNPLTARDVAADLSGGLAVEPDGKILIFNTFGENPKQFLLQRLNADGTIDAEFDAGSNFDGDISTIVAQPDGKILIGGNFSGVNGFNRAGLVRLNPDSSLDPTFQTDNSFGVRLFDLQSNGKIVVFTVNGRFIRLNGDGRADFTVFRLTNSS